ncbi:MAG: sensor histidine kinase [Acidobacteriaceae bacterium]|nr:sensor histidine kinase [Acidobacteriaceae bacterium]
MKRPAQLLRIAGAFACVTSSISYAADVFWRTQSTRSAALLELARPYFPPMGLHLFLILGPIAVAALFWHSTRMDDRDPPRKASLISLAIQASLAFLTSFDLLPSIGLEAGLLFPSRLGLFWVLGQAALEFLACALHPGFQTWLLGPMKAPVSWSYYVVVGAVQCSFIHFVTYACGAMGAVERKQRRALIEKNEKLESLNSRLVAMKDIEAESARLAERLHISRELHDAIGHHLTALSLKLQLAHRLSTDKAKTAVAEAYQLTRLLLSDVRNVVKDLRETDRNNLLTALQTLTARIASPEIHLTVAEEVPYLEPHIAHTVFRCAQEVVTNTLRHSNARNLWLSVERHDGTIVFRGYDDGKGAPLLRIGNGLRGMTERVEQTGGVLHFSSVPGRGFEVVAELPVDGTEIVRRYA